MSKIAKWIVLRDHEGDRHYKAGETREGTREQLGHLAPKTLLPINEGTGAKAEPAPMNKAEGASANKAATRRKSR